MYKVVLLRHGESAWNKENRFTGWTDVDLSQKGIEEAISAGKIMKDQGYIFDIVFTSVLKRALRTTWLALEQMDLLWIPEEKSWRLNERHYGALQGLNKAETAEKHGEEQVMIWRRSYDIPPPELNKTDPRYPGHELRYMNLDEKDIPKTESLKDTVARFLPYWHKVIAPTIRTGKRVLISAHGNSLRALVKYLDNMSNEAVIALNIPTGVPLVYELDDNLKPIKHYYLGDAEEIIKKAAAVAAQGKAKS